MAQRKLGSKENTNIGRKGFTDRKLQEDMFVQDRKEGVDLKRLRGWGERNKMKHLDVRCEGML